jgi:hypothetical protein
LRVQAERVFRPTTLAQCTAVARRRERGWSDARPSEVLVAEATRREPGDHSPGRESARSAPWAGGPTPAPAAVARSIPVIAWNLLTQSAARYQDLGAGYASRIDKGKR